MTECGDIIRCHTKGIPMLKNIIVLGISLVALMACNPKTPRGSVQTVNNQGLPVHWDFSSSLPLTIKVDTNFTETEYDQIRSAANQWEVASGLNLFGTFSRTSEYANATLTWEYIYSSRDQTQMASPIELGIYKKVDHWFTEYPENGFQDGILGITNYIAVKTTDIYGNAYYKILHADIIINDATPALTPLSDNDTDPTSGQYDLITVLLHELGHFVGHAHHNDAEPSVMNSYLDKGVKKRILYQTDKNFINSLYHPSGSALRASGIAAVYEDDGVPMGSIVMGIIELKSSGHCEHKRYIKN